jgi:hypothetical protein
VAPENTLFIAGEPPSKKIYPRRFHAQFHRVVSTHVGDPHPRVTTSLPGLNWHVGLDRDEDRYRYGYDHLKPLPLGRKSPRISVVCSNLTTTAGQRQRLALLDFLKAALGDTIVHFGRGFTPIGDKMEAIQPHRFHLVLENSCSPDYWTEKLSDAYLGWAHPLYAGCPNLDDYFPAAGFTAVDVTRPAAALEVIRARLEQPVDLEALACCRELILDTYNPFARFAYWAEAFYQADQAAAGFRADGCIVCGIGNEPLPLSTAATAVVQPLPAAHAAAADREPNFAHLLTDFQRWDALGVVHREQGDEGRFPWVWSAGWKIA